MAEWSDFDFSPQLKEELSHDGLPARSDKISSIVTAPVSSQFGSTKSPGTSIETGVCLVID
jgi:hypothetical protein